MEWENIEIESSKKKQVIISGLSIEKWLEDEKLLQAAKKEWKTNS